MNSDKLTKPVKPTTLKPKLNVHERARKKYIDMLMKRIPDKRAQKEVMHLILGLERWAGSCTIPRMNLGNFVAERGTLIPSGDCDCGVCKK